MKVQYFSDTDTMLIIFKDADIAETKELDENTYIEVDSEGKLVCLTIEHAKERTSIDNFQIERIAA